MKALKVLFAASAALLLAVACQKYDDSALTGRVSALEQKVSSVESQIAALQTAINNKVTVDKVEQTPTGWIIYLTDKTTITLSNGKDGKDGKDGVDGKDGTPGKDGKDGVDGKDGAPGKDGKDGDSFFKSVTVEGGYVKIILNDEAQTEFILPLAIRIVIGPEDKDFIETQYGVATNVQFTLPNNVEIATYAATVLYADGSATDVKTKASDSDWSVEIKSEKNLEIKPGGNAQFKDAILQITAIAKDGSTYVASKLVKITGLVYHDQGYGIVKLADGKVWMADNLRYVPEGFTPSADLANVTAGVYYPVVVNGDKTAAVFGTETDVLTSGYLYQTEVALGLNVGDLTSIEQAQSLEGVQGICPDGWHIPTIDDITGLVGKAVSPITTKTDAPYYNGTNGSLMLLNQDGFGMWPCGAITIQDNTKTAATLMGFLKNYEVITSGYYCGSSYAGVSYSKTDPTVITNFQFYGLMPMTNKPAEADYTCNGSKLSYRIGASVRCVKDSSHSNGIIAR